MKRNIELPDAADQVSETLLVMESSRDYLRRFPRLPEGYLGCRPFHRLLTGLAWGWGNIRRRGVDDEQFTGLSLLLQIAFLTSNLKQASMCYISLLTLSGINDGEVSYLMTLAVPQIKDSTNSHDGSCQTTGSSSVGS